MKINPNKLSAILWTIIAIFDAVNCVLSFGERRTAINVAYICLCVVAVGLAIYYFNVYKNEKKN